MGRFLLHVLMVFLAIFTGFLITGLVSLLVGISATEIVIMFVIPIVVFISAVIVFVRKRTALFLTYGIALLAFYVIMVGVPFISVVFTGAFPVPK